MEIAIVKYNAGNIQSVQYALERFNVTANVTDNPDEIRNADKVIFPGVGEASSAMNYLKANKLDEVLKSLHQPFLGICLGMQLMCKHSEENDTECLGIFDVSVKRFPPKDKVPHMGWNTIFDNKSPLLKGVDENEYMYFVHSFFAEKHENTAATCNYIADFSAGLQKDNYFAFQFHPEKSGTAGAKIIENFLNI